jgi:hypothetical protein
MLNQDKRLTAVELLGLAQHGARRMRQELLIAEFLEQLKHRADEQFKGRLEQSFVSWCVEAEFGDVPWEFTDGPNDSGIDAILWCNNEDPSVIILQSKFSDKIGKNKLGGAAYDEFELVVRGFRFGDDQFQQILDGAADELRKHYIKAYEKLADGNSWHTRKKAFRLVTTNKRNSEKEFDSIPQDGFIYNDYLLDLYKKYRIVQTPKARPLDLTVQSKLSYQDVDRRTTSYLFNARVSDFRRYLDKNDVARLVARNIRYNLGKNVGRAIRATYENKPKDFWYLHNGLTVLCDECVERNQTATLIGPSVVNGAQTLYAIASSPVKDSSALVIVRVIVRGDTDEQMDDDQWVQRVIRGVNTQNKVEPYDFRSNDPEQVELQRKFKEQRVFYERKRGEWKEVRTDPKFKGHARLALRTLAQIITAVSDDKGQGVLLVKRGSAPLFEDKHYKKLFPSRKKVAYRFKRFYFAYRLFRLLNKSSLGCSTKREYRKRMHSFWSVLWVLHQVLIPTFTKYKLSVEQIREVFDEFEGKSFRGIRARKVVKSVSKAVWQAYRVGRKKDPEHWTPNNFFKQKYGIRVIQKLAIPKAKDAVTTMASFLISV